MLLSVIDVHFLVWQVFFENMVTGILTYDDPRVIEDPVPSIALKVLAMTSPLNTSVAAGHYFCILLCWVFASIVIRTF